MIKGSYTAQELRSHILSSMQVCYRKIKAIDRKLASSRFTRVYKDPTCKACENREADREWLECDLNDYVEEIKALYMALPEVRVDTTLHITAYKHAMAFAEKLVRKPRKRRFQKNQGMLMAVEVT